MTLQTTPLIQARSEYLLKTTDDDKNLDLTAYISCQLWLDSFKSKQTKIAYSKHLKMFCRFYRTDPDRLLKKKDKELETMIIKYVIHLKQVAQPVTGKPVSGRLSVNSIHSYIFGVRRFLKFHRRLKGIDWDTVLDIMPDKSRTTWRAYTREEIQRLLSIADMRQKVAILLMASGGLRVGALPEIRFKDLHVLPSGVGSLSVYSASEKDQYFTFITPECLAAIESYKAWRIAQHERITPESFILRDKYTPLSAKTNRPKQLHLGGLLCEMRRLTKKALPIEVTDTVQTDHAFRKFFKQSLRRAGADPLVIEYLIGHKSGDPKSGITQLMITYDPSDYPELLQEYSKGLDVLSITDEYRVKKQIVLLQKELENAAPKDMVADFIIREDALKKELIALRQKQDKTEADNLTLKKKLAAELKRELLAELASIRQPPTSIKDSM